MALIFRTMDEHNLREVTQFNRLMGMLEAPAADQGLLRQRIHEANRSPDKCLLVCEDTDKRMLCGTVLGVCFGDFCGDCKSIMVIENLITHPDYRGQGVGRGLLAQLEAWGKERGAYYSILCSSNHRTEAHEFYPAVGYEEVKGFKKFL